MRKYKIVEVEWEDASHYGREKSDKEIKETCNLQLVRTIGYLIQRGRKVIKVAGEIIEGGDLRDTSVISRLNVRHINYLEKSNAIKER